MPALPGKENGTVGMDIFTAYVAPHGVERSYRKGTPLFNAEDEAHGFFYIKSGEVRVFKMDTDGNELEMGRFGPGDFIGEIILFAAERYPAFAEATKNTIALYFEKNKILNAITHEPALSTFFLKLLAGKCLVLSKRIEMLGLKTVRQRLIQYVLSQCPGSGSNCTLELKIKKTELAKLLGTVSETLSRNLRQLQDEKLITVKGKRITLLNCPQLRRETFQD